jgi:clostripain
MRLGGRRPRLPLFVLLALATLLGPASLARADNSSWTVLVYLDGDNNLESAAIADLNQMEAAPGNAAVKVLVQFDRAPGYDSTNGDWTDTRRFLVTPDSGATTLGSTQVWPTTTANYELNMGDPETLVDFIAWGVQNYPADHYLLILWDHGDGWRAASLGGEPSKSICLDDTSSDRLTTPELMSALAAATTSLGGKLDIVACDACEMGMLELAYPLRDDADYYVASEELVPNAGFPYDTLLELLDAQPTLTPAQLCRVMVGSYAASYNSGSQGYAKVTLSALDLARVVPVAAALDTFATELLSAELSDSGYARSVHNAADRTGLRLWESGSDTEYKDLYAFAEAIEEGPPTEALGAAAVSLQQTIRACVLSSAYVGFPEGSFHGLTIYYPAPGSGRYLTSYGDLALAQDTSWDTLLTSSPATDLYASDPFEPDGAKERATAVTLGQDLGKRWLLTLDEDWASFVAESGKQYLVTTEHLGPFADPTMTVYASDGTTVIGSDDNSGAEALASRLDLADLAAGTYYVQTQQSQQNGRQIFVGGGSAYDLLVSEVAFTDVPAGFWAFRQVQACVAAGLVQGYADGTYQPSLQVSRDQMAVYVARALAGGDSAVPTPSGAPSFADVPADYWAYKYVEYAVQNAVVQGYADGYHPTETVDRAQMAVFIARAIVTPTGEGGLSGYTPPGEPTFTDVATSYWAYKHIEYLADFSRAVVRGFWDDSYHPEAVVTRDQMAAYLARAFSLPL